MAEARDAPRLAWLVKQAFEPYIAEIGRAPAPMVADFPALIAAGDVWCWGDRADFEAYAVFRAENGNLLLDTIAIAPKAQGQGLGRRLMAEIEAYGQARGGARLCLYTNAKMAAARAFYPKLGYQEQGRWAEDGFDRIYFVKMLSPVLQGFVAQAAICSNMGSPFTAAVLEAAADVIARVSETGRCVLDWTGDTTLQGDAVALRFAAALQDMVRAGKAGALAAHYGAEAVPERRILADDIAAAISSNDAEMAQILVRASQNTDTGQAAYENFR